LILSFRSVAILLSLIVVAGYAGACNEEVVSQAHSLLRGNFSCGSVVCAFGERGCK